MTILQISQGYSKYAPSRSGTVLGTVAALFVVLLLAPSAARAWMFCWNSKATGIENCWGYPPPWYLNGGGPHTIVWLDGTLMDDTAWPPERHQDAKRTVLRAISAENVPAAPPTFEQRAQRRREETHREAQRALADTDCLIKSHTHAEYMKCRSQLP